VLKYWPNVYQKWDGHFAGSKVIEEISAELNRLRIYCPLIQHDPNPGVWTPWKVNMALFSDDVIKCSDDSESEKIRKNPTTSASGIIRRPSGGIRVQITESTGGNISCGHRIVNENFGIHFEPLVISKINNSDKLNLPLGEHGLENYRLLLEFFRMTNGNCKISCRIRLTDLSFDKLLEIVRDTQCPQKAGGINLASKTESIFVYPLGKIAKGDERHAITKFTCKPKSWYSNFLKQLPEALSI